MARFDIAYARTNASEGGHKLSLDPNDNGNWTGGKMGIGKLIGSKFGVSAPLLSQYLGRNATASEMANLSSDIAKAIAKIYFWDKIAGDKINDQEQANIIYDNAYNIGIAPAIKMAQTILGMPTTGIMDELTINKINS